MLDDLVNTALTACVAKIIDAEPVRDAWGSLVRLLTVLALCLACQVVLLLAVAYKLFRVT
jgi:hypothetical protein